MALRNSYARASVSTSFTVASIVRQNSSAHAPRPIRISSRRLAGVESACMAARRVVGVLARAVKELGRR